MSDQSYHQTQGYLTTDQVEQYQVSAGTQEEMVLAWFKRRPGVAYSPEQIQALVLPDAPLTSARRAITNLTAAGYLVQTDRSTVGRYGRPVGTWQLAAQHEPGQLRLF